MGDLRPDLGLALDAFGVPATVTVPGGSAVVTRGIWLSPRVTDQPYGSDFGRRDPARIMALPRDVLSTMPRGTSVVAAEVEGGTVRTWTVAELDSAVDPDCWRVVLEL